MADRLPAACLQHLGRDAESLAAPLDLGDDDEVDLAFAAEPGDRLRLDARPLLPATGDELALDRPHVGHVVEVRREQPEERPAMLLEARIGARYGKDRNPRGLTAGSQLRDAERSVSDVGPHHPPAPEEERHPQARDRHPAEPAIGEKRLDSRRPSPAGALPHLLPRIRPGREGHDDQADDQQDQRRAGNDLGPPEGPHRLVEDLEYAPGGRRVHPDDAGSAGLPQSMEGVAAHRWHSKMRDRDRTSGA